MTARRITTPSFGALCILASGLGACSTLRAVTGTPPPPPAPPPAAMETHRKPFPPMAAPTVVVSPAVTACAGDAKCVKKVQLAHRQYFDQRRKRYYYYDPSHRTYFWEDGTPKTSSTATPQ